METRPADASPTAPEDDDDFTYLPESAQDTEPVQVSSLVAIIRIVSVLAMGLCVSFGLFIMLVGIKGIIVGVPIVLLAIPCYYGMQLAEKLAKQAEEQHAAGES